MTQRLFHDKTEQVFMEQADAVTRGTLIKLLDRAQRTVWVVAIPPKPRIDKPYQGRFGKHGTKRFKQAREDAVLVKATGMIKPRRWEFLMFVAGIVDNGEGNMVVYQTLISSLLLSLTHTQFHRTPGAISLLQGFISEPILRNFMDWLSVELYGEAGVVSWQVVNDPSDVLGL